MECLNIDTGPSIESRGLFSSGSKVEVFTNEAHDCQNFTLACISANKEIRVQGLQVTWFSY